jgi:GNAT superfamily N-acetyltransferase
VERAAALAAYDSQIRRSLLPDGSGAVAEADGPVVRCVTVDGRGWSGVTWSDLSESTADSVLARQVAYFRDRGEEFEWKHYDYDRPPDLPARLLRAGFAAEPEEALMTAEAPAVAAEAPLPPGVRLVPVTDEAGVNLLIEVHERVFGKEQSRHRQSLTAQLRDSPETIAMVVAMAGGEPVCAARAEFLPGRDFAGLWGGGTLRQWRGQGIYRALVAYRARLAVERGYRYLQVDASRNSEPILGRLGFAVLARTTPYIWRPAAG